MTLKTNFLLVIIKLITSSSLVISITKILDSKPIEVIGDNYEILEICIDHKKRMSDKALIKLLESSRSCKKNSDCTTLFTGNIQTPFGCRNVPLRKDKVEIILNAIDFNKCEHIGSCYLRDSCRYPIKISACIQGKCF